MEDLLKKATELGTMIAAQECCQEMYKAEMEIGNRPDLKKIIDDYENAFRNIQAKEAAGQPIEVADKQAMEETRKVMASDDFLQGLSKYQTDFAELMHNVNEAIGKGMNPA